jgi:hypothetical protein
MVCCCTCVRNLVGLRGPNLPDEKGVHTCGVCMVKGGHASTAWAAFMSLLQLQKLPPVVLHCYGPFATDATSNKQAYGADLC